MEYEEGVFCLALMSIWRIATYFKALRYMKMFQLYQTSQGGQPCVHEEAVLATGALCTALGKQCAYHTTKKNLTQRYTGFYLTIYSL